MLEPVRIILFTGKGGVGKTTVAAATALHAAANGARTLVLSTDPAHSLADVFDAELDTRPRELAPRLWGQQLDAQERMEESWGEIRDYLVEVFDWAGVNSIEAEELAVFPGLDEIFALSDIRRFARSDRWDVILVDCAPTAETIRFLSLPDILSWYMDRVFPVSRKVNRVVGPVLSKVTSLPVASDNVFSATRRFYEQLDGVKELLADNRRSTVRLVVNPERMVIAEARRTYTYLSLFGYRVDAVIANRLLPDVVADPWFDRWKQLHAEHLRTIEEAFAPVPVLRAELASDELVGFDALADFASKLFGDLDPAAVLYDDEPMSLDRGPDEFVLTVHLPFADHDDLEVGRCRDELFVRVGPYRRALLLPDSIRHRPVTSAALRDGRLRVTFADAGGATKRAARR
ncbi:MAG: ArsA family ATPase [Acidimicrobiales bacterium]|nr:ArsA family ATPase [Acidimicrobiales bacterium]